MLSTNELKVALQVQGPSPLKVVAEALVGQQVLLLTVYEAGQVQTIAEVVIVYTYPLPQVQVSPLKVAVPAAIAVAGQFALAIHIHEVPYEATRVVELHPHIVPL